MNIVVIGSGIAGLAASCRLATNGHKVTLLEKNEQLGGKISTVKKDGFTWDGGPSFFTDPTELKQLFIDCGRDPNKYFEYFEIDEACRYWFEGKIVHGYGDPEKLTKEFFDKFDEPKENTIRFLKDIKIIYEQVGARFLNKPFTLIRVLDLKTILTVIKTQPRIFYKPIHSLHKHYFERTETLQFFDRFATYVGADPLRAPGFLVSTPYLEHIDGAHQIKGGMRSITDATTRLAKSLGVRIITEFEVSNFEIKDNLIKSVTNGDEILPVDNLVNASDVSSVYKIVDPVRFKKHTHKEMSLSAYVQYLGVKKGTEKTYLHNVLFSKDYVNETNKLWNGKPNIDDPTIYVNNTSFFESNDAPKGYENWFVMVNLPAGYDSEKLEHIRKGVMKKLSKIYGKDFEKRIVTSAESLTPSKMSKKYNSYKGSIYGIAANSFSGAYFRPKNKDQNIKNLYHVGVTTHPGGGIPLALRSARIVSDMIEENESTD